MPTVPAVASHRVGTPLVMRARLRVVTFNLNGAFHGNRSTFAQQTRAWHHLAALDVMTHCGVQHHPLSTKSPITRPW